MFNLLGYVGDYPCIKKSTLGIIIITIKALYLSIFEKKLELT